MIHSAKELYTFTFSVSLLMSTPSLKGSPLVCFGRSLGGSVAVSLAAAFPADVQAVVLENTYTNISDMIDRLMPLLSPLKALCTMKWDSSHKIQHLTQPVFFISGDSDELVPTSHMVTLHELAVKSRLVVFFSVRGGTHNDTWERAGNVYYEVRFFLNWCQPCAHRW